MNSVLKGLAVAAMALALSGCGAFDRQVARFTGGASEVCVGGVVYLQFTSGSSVGYNQDGSLRTC